MLCMDQQPRTDIRTLVRRRLTSTFQLFGSIPKSEYRSIVADIVAVLASRRVPYGDVYARSLGAFPTLVKDALIGNKGYLGDAPREQIASVAPDDEPTPWEDDELDPLDAQWYFDMSTARRIVEMFPSGTTSVLALGMPTVASVAAADIEDVTLVDISPRFSPGGAAEWPALKNVNIVRHDLDENKYLNQVEVDVVIMDPPWYIENYLAWLHSAVSACRYDGLLIVALPQILASRRSLPERQEIIEILRSVGTVDLVADALSYVTPSFELPVLKADNLHFLTRWRRADLALVNLRKKDLPYEFPSQQNMSWKYRNVCGRVVRSYSESPTAGILPEIQPLIGSNNYRLIHVTRNYLWSSSANLVTSRGHAASVTKWGSLPHILDLLEGGHALDDAVSGALPGATPQERKWLTGTLDTILER